jgi:HPt (histidine-containing phosphotransfer) domain-containing protein
MCSRRAAAVSAQDDSPRDLIAEVDSSSSAPTPDERRSVEASPTEDAASFAPSAIADDVEPAILRDVLFSNLGGNLFVIKHILRKFVERSQATMTSLQQQSREEDWSALRREAHSLKGASGYVAAAQLNKRALALLLAAEEKKAGREPEPLIDFCLAQVGAEMQRVMLQIAVILEEEDAEG